MNSAPRTKSANRDQLIFDVIDYDKLIPESHRARTIVSFVEKLNLETFYSQIKAREGIAGRSAIDPKLLLSLWLYATLEGIGSARLLEKLCERDCAFRWICGGVLINYHTLSDFRANSAIGLDQLLTDIVSTLILSGIATIKTIAQDGTKKAASASMKSFKTRKQLGKLKKAVELQVKALRSELEKDSSASQTRAEARRQQDILKREKRIAKALSELPKVEATKEAAKKKVKKGTKISEAKVSLSDPEARIMKFADGSTDAGYNAQVAYDPESHIVVSVDMTNQGNDKNLLKPMVENIESRYEGQVERVLVDTGYPTHQDIIDLAERENPILVYSPLPKKKENVKPESERKRKLREENYAEPVKAFNRRMKNRASQKIYKRRSRIETFNGILHNRMTTGFHVRGKAKAKSELLLHVIGHNIMQSNKLTKKAA